MPAELLRLISSAYPLLSLNLPKMFGCHHFQVTRDDQDSCILIFSSPRAATRPSQNGILVEVFHPSYGFIVRIHHYFSAASGTTTCVQDTKSSMPVRQPHSMRNSGLGTFRYFWVTRFGRRPIPWSPKAVRGRVQVYIAETQSKSEPGTPFEDDETECSDTEWTRLGISWAKEVGTDWGRLWRILVGHSVKLTMYSKRHNNPRDKPFLRKWCTP